jgi:hypothetical protein
MENSQVIVWIKNALYLPSFLIAIGFPEQTAWSIAILTILMLVDFITGIAASSKINGWCSITSKRMTAGALSKLIILLIPFIIAITGKGIGVDFMTYVQGSLIILILSEAYSNLGNIQSFRTGEKVTEVDAISLILKLIRKKFYNLLKNNIDKV